MGRIVIATAGAIIGGYFGGPAGAQAGWAIGSYVGGAMFPEQVKGARLGDLSAIRVEYGSVRPIVRGRMRVTPSVLWASEKREIASTSSQGKGGGSVEQTTYTYVQDVLYELSDGPIGGVSRVWSNGELVYCALAGTDDASLANSTGAELWEAMIVYAGDSEDALPDETYEAAVGVGSAPAYVGRATVMVRSLNLGSGGYMPTLEFEVTTAGEVGAGTFTIGAIAPIFVPWNCGTAAANGNTRFRVPIGQWDNGYGNGNVIVYDIDLIDGSAEQVGSYSVPSGASWNVLSGSTDVTCLAYASSSTLSTFLDVSGLAVTYNLPSGDVWSSDARYVRKGEHLVVISNWSASTRRLYRYSSTGSALLASSDVLPDYVRWMEIAGDYLYAATKTSGVIYKIDIETLTIQQTISRPAPSLYPRLFLINGQLGVVESSSLYLWSGSSWRSLGSISSDFVPANGTGAAFGTVGSLLVGAHAVSGVGYKTYFAPITIDPQPLDLADEVSWLCGRAGLDASDIDVTDLAGVEVTGYAITQVSPVRSTLEMLAQAHYFEAVESDKLYFRRRGGAAVATLAWDDIGAAEDADAPDDRLGHQRGSDEEVPARVNLSYYNVDDDCQRGAVQSDRLIAIGTGDQSIELPVALTPAQAQGIADTAVLDARVSATTFAPSIAWHTHPAVEPTDVVTLTDDQGTTYRSRVVRETMTGMVRSLECVADDAGVLQGVGVTATFAPTTTVLGHADTALQVLDIPILRDGDDAPGVYAAMAREQAGSRWLGAQLLTSIDGVSYAVAGEVTRSATLGETTTALGAWDGGWVMDTRNTVTVSVNGTLASVTREALLSSSANAAVIGNELIQFQTATLVAAGVYTLSGLLRGRRGTESAMGSHAVGDGFVLLTDNGILRVPHDASRLNVETSYKGVSIGRAIDTSDPVALVDTGRSLQPPAPVDVRAARDSDGGLTISWKRRTRYGTTFCGPAGIGVPLGESTESYVCELHTTSDYNSLLSSYASASPSVYIPIDAQDDWVNDAGFSVFPTGIIYVKVWQVGAIAGRACTQPVAIPAYDAGTVSVPGLDVVRAFFWHDLSTGTTTHAADLTGYGGIGDGSTLVRQATHAAPAGRWLASLNVRSESAAQSTYYSGSVAQIAVQPGYYAAGVGYDPSTDGYILLVGSAQYGPYTEYAVTSAGALTSSTAVTLSGGTQLAAPILFKFGSTWHAFERAGSLARVAYRTSAGAWTIAGSMVGVTSYACQIVGVQQISSTLFASVLATDTSSQAVYLRIYTSTDGSSWTRLTSFLISTSTFEVEAAQYAPRLHTLPGGRLVQYAGISGSGVKAHRSDVTGATWEALPVTVDGAAGLTVDHIVATTAGIAGRYIEQLGFDTARAWLVTSTDGVAFTKVSDAATYTTGYGATAGDYMADEDSTIADIRAPIVGSGSSVLFERALQKAI